MIIFFVERASERAYCIILLAWRVLEEVGWRIVGVGKTTNIGEWGDISDINHASTYGLLELSLSNQIGMAGECLN